LVRRSTTIEWRNKRLHDRCRAVERTGITPRFEIMRLGQVPRRKTRRLIFVQPQTKDLSNLRQVIGKLEIGRTRIDRIATQDEQSVHRPLIHSGDQFLKRIDLSFGARADWLSK